MPPNPQSPSSSSLTSTSEGGSTSGVTSTLEFDEIKPQRPGSSIDLSAKLSCCGLAQYFEVLVQNGFDSWDVVLDIQEGDLKAMEFKLGHRRKLQRQIINHYFHTTSSQSQVLPLNSRHAKVPSIEKLVLNCTDEASTSTKVLKRKYKRHPKCDDNAPKKPKTGYVLFSNHMRSCPEVAVMSFDAIAKHVGHNWQSHSLAGRKIWEDRAANDMSLYFDCLETYKQSNSYTAYEAYLADFKEVERGQASIGSENVSTQEQEVLDKPDGSASSKVSESNETCQDTQAQVVGATTSLIEDHGTDRALSDGHEPCAQWINLLEWINPDFL